MSRGELTERQKEVFEFIKTHVREKGYPPSIREIGVALCFKSTASVHDYIAKLEQKGYIRRSKSKSRSIEVLEANVKHYAAEYVDVPIIGRVAAGAPVLAVENMEGYFPVPVGFLGASDAFMLRVAGDSMIEAGILDGDLILVQRQPFAADGAVVVALLDGSVTVKRYETGENYVRLISENSNYQDIITRKVDILGIVIGLYRQM
jgi:repressor LexA